MTKTAQQLPEEVTQLLLKWSDGDRAALDDLIPMVYDDLRRLAHHYLRSERAGHTLQTTALAHEVYFRLANQKNVKWQNRGHFFAVCAKLMRRILVDYARSRAYAKREGEARKTALDEARTLVAERPADIVAIDEALKALEALDPRKSQVVELRFFGGLTIEETAEALQVSHATVEREWTTARAWLYREISGGSPDES
ncbi:MAG TPA: sigma-70 family RNA polymerase sigma factor [Blastocatellia bacterium]|nr:sigma-70 family RNA polymerase sigma factor [Blastocatellia bacterium]